MCGYIPSISDQIDRLLPSVPVKRLFVSGKLTSSNSNQLQKVCKDGFMVNESACKSFVQHQEVLALKAQKRATKRNKLPNIDWNDEYQVSSLTANKLRLYFNQHHLQVSGGKVPLVRSSCSALCSCWSDQDSLETEVNATTSDSELQSSDSKDEPDDSEDDVQ